TGNQQHFTNMTFYCQDSILEPLCFPEPPLGGPSAPSAPSPPGDALLVCLLCPESAPLWQNDALLKHLLLEHQLVIADVKLVADLPKYMLYWRRRFLELPLTDFCSVIKTNASGPIEKQENYFLLCDVLPEDRVLREKLQQKRLEEVLEQQQQERDDGSFRRLCMFCSDEFSGNRSSLLNHMAREHSFSIGLPDNIVYCHQFLDTLQAKLDSLQCLYCEKTFRDKTTLKDHMRKKAHRRINASNSVYDRFYVINYLELGKSWEEVQSEDDRELLDDEEEDDWSDWRARPVCAVCLFCDDQSETMEQIYSHMKVLKHQVKLVNFIRRQLHQRRCYGCQQRFESRDGVLRHLEVEGHVMTLPDAATWNQPQYYFPTYENDALLCSLSDDGDDGDVPVIAEDVCDLRALQRSSVLSQLLRRGGACS
uniref:Zinc finger protein 277 n=1 Tax=Cyclopterus lumpus TaxID=8103 RepID=A0A8C2X3M9_CYCLU